MMGEPEDLLQLTHATAETTSLDFKGPTAFDKDSREEVAELLKDVTALANRDGGHLVIGVREVTPGFDRRGLTGEQAASFETTQLATSLSKYMDPPLRLTVHQLSDTADGTHFVVIRVQPFDEVPHICCKRVVDSTGQKTLVPEGTLFIRTDACQSKPVSTSAELRVLLDRMLRRKSDYLVDRVEGAIGVALEPRTTTPPAAGRGFELSRAAFLRSAPDIRGQ